MTARVAEAQHREQGNEGFFAARRLGHVNLYVADVDRSYAFYKNIVGLSESYVQPLNKAAFLGNNNTHHDVAVIDIHGPLGRNNSVGLNHLAFELETEIDLVAGYKRAAAGDVTFTMTLDHDIAHSLYGPDPDGNLNEIYADVIKDWRAARSGVVTKPKPKWAPGMTPPNPDRNYHVDPPLQRVESAVFHPRRIVHAALVVKDMRAAYDYYTNVVGLRPLLGSAQSAFVVLGGTCGERNLSLFRAGNGRPPGYHHAGFQAWNEAELNASVARAKGQGLKIEMDIDHRFRRSVVVNDPDGFRIQFFVDRDPSIATLGSVDENTALYLA
jgi:catechol 2,3-dioxygenase